MLFRVCCFIFCLVLLSSNIVFSDTIRFSSELKYYQIGEYVTITIDNQVACTLRLHRSKLNIDLLSQLSDQCDFQVTKRLHQFKINGYFFEKDRAEITRFDGKGEGFIIDIRDAVQGLKDTEDDPLMMIKTFNELVEQIRQLPNNGYHQLEKIIFINQETAEHVEHIEKQRGLKFPSSYRQMIIEHGYPELEIDNSQYLNFIKISEQPTLIQMLEEDYGYNLDEYLSQEILSKYTADFAYKRASDDADIFQKNFDPSCPYQTSVDYIFFQEALYHFSYRQKSCNSFEVFFKELLIDMFIQQVGYMFEVVFDEGQLLKLDLNYEVEFENTTLYYWSVYD